MAADLTVEIAGTPVPVELGDNSALAGDLATRAAVSAATAGTHAASMGQVLIDASAFEVDISATYPYLKALFKKIVLLNAKAHDYRVSLVGTAANRFRVHIWDVQQADQVAYFDFDPVTEYGSYAALDGVRIPLIGNDPLGADYTGMTGYVEIYTAAVVQNGAVYQPTSFAEGGIRRTNVHTRFSVRDKHPAENYEEVIVFGTGETYTTLAAAAESLYDEPLADPMGIAVMPTCERCDPFHKIALLAKPGTYTPQNVHLPDWVSVIGQHRHAAVFEHPGGATLPMIQAHLNHDLVDLTFRTTVAGEYAVHTDYAHGYMGADTEGDENREFLFRSRRNQWIVGAGMNYQPYGSGIGINCRSEFEEDEFLSESSTFTAPFAAAHNTDSLGGGRFRFTRCVDKSGRTDKATVIVQTTYTNTYKSFLEINDCEGFTAITSHQQVGGVTHAWRGVGNYDGPVYVDQATFAGQLLEFASVAVLRNTSGSSVAAGKAVTRDGRVVSGLAQDGSPVDAIAFEAVGNNAEGRFFVGRRLDARMLTISGAGTPSWLYVANGVLTTTVQASGVRVGHLSGGVVRLL